jgi:hypothetical protein
MDGVENRDANDRPKPSKRRVLQDPVNYEQQQDEANQISSNLSPPKTEKKGWFGRRTTSSGQFDLVDSPDKDTLTQRAGGSLPSSKGQAYVALNQDPFQPGST